MLLDFAMIFISTRRNHDPTVQVAPDFHLKYPLTGEWMLDLKHIIL